MSHRKLFLTAALCLTGGVGTAQARDVDVQWSVTIGTPVYAGPIVQFVPPAPVYFRPVPVPAPIAVYVQPEQRYLPPGRWPAARWQATRWDRDADGIPDRHDRLYNPRWDRDGDGIPNRRDDHDDTQRGDFRGSGGAARPGRHGGQGRQGD